MSAGTFAMGDWSAALKYVRAGKSFKSYGNLSGYPTERRYIDPGLLPAIAAERLEMDAEEGRVAYVMLSFWTPIAWRVTVDGGHRWRIVGNWWGGYTARAVSTARMVAGQMDGVAIDYFSSYSTLSDRQRDLLWDVAGNMIAGGFVTGQRVRTARILGQYGLIDYRQTADVHGRRKNELASLTLTNYGRRYIADHGGDVRMTRRELRDLVLTQH